MDDLLSCVVAHLSSRGPEGFSNDGAQSLVHIVETLQGQEEESAVQTAMAGIRKALRSGSEQRPPSLLTKATARRKCEVNEDIFNLLHKCKDNPSAIFESQGSGTAFCAVHNLSNLHRLGTQLFNGRDDLRRHVFCIIISDAHDIVRKRTRNRSSRAIAQLAKDFAKDGDGVSIEQLRKDLQLWMTCGAGHQLVMESLGDGYLAVLPPDIPVGILLTKYARRSQHRQSSIKHLEAWGVPRVAKKSGANEIIKKIRQYYQDFFRMRTPQPSASIEIPIMDGDRSEQGTASTTWNEQTISTSFGTELSRSFEPSSWPLNEQSTQELISQDPSTTGLFTFQSTFSQDPPTMVSFFDTIFSQNPPTELFAFGSTSSQDPSIIEPTTFEQGFSHNPPMIESFNQNS